MIKIDTDGRVILSSSLREHANIDSEVVFVGLGEKFQIWEPNNFKAHLLEARERVKKQRNLLRVNNKKIIEGVLK
jgi:MraZ protein